MRRILIAEDDLVSRKFLGKLLSKYGECDLVVDGSEAIEAYMLLIGEKEHYDLICLDIMMPKVDGVKVLKFIRDYEEQNKIDESKRAKIVMTTALGDTPVVKAAMDFGCDAYASKPIDTNKLIEVLSKFGFAE